MPSWRRDSARTATNEPSDRVCGTARVHHVASDEVSRVAPRPATTASRTGRTRSVTSGRPRSVELSLLSSTASAAATRASCTTTAARRARLGRRTPLSWSSRGIRTTSPTAATATVAAPSPTSPPAASDVHGTRRGKPGTNQASISSSTVPTPTKPPTGTARASSVSGSDIPSDHIRRRGRPRSAARASSGIRRSAAAVSRRSSSASATSTRLMTAGETEARAVACWSRTSSTTPSMSLMERSTSCPPGRAVLRSSWARATSATRSRSATSRSAGTASRRSTSTS